jgi:hypothetical protein
MYLAEIRLWLWLLSLIWNIPNCFTETKRLPVYVSMKSTETDTVYIHHCRQVLSIVGGVYLYLKLLLLPLLFPGQSHVHSKSGDQNWREVQHTKAKLGNHLIAIINDRVDPPRIMCWAYKLAVPLPRPFVISRRPRSIPLEGNSGAALWALGSS